MALLVLSVIVLFHEFGHFLLAKINGIGVVEFSLGFGPRLLSWKSKKSGTRYSVKIIPFGGSCAMYGEFEDEDEQENEKNEQTDSSEAELDELYKDSRKFKRMSEEEATRKEFAEGKHGDSFFAKSPLARMSVIAAGPIFNFIMAFVCAVAVVSWAGYDMPQIAEVVKGQAAEMAGLQQGDVITKIGNRNVMLTRDVILYMTVNSNEDMPIEFKRLNETTGQWEKHESFLNSEYYYYQDGRYLSGMNFYGFRSATESLADLLKYSMAEVRYTICSVIDSLGQLAGGEVAREDIAGPVRIVTIIDETVETVSPAGTVAVFMNVLNLILMFSANLGVMNLLPFPALDGGRIVFLLWELIRRKPVNQTVENALNLAGMALLMIFMVFVVFNDLTILF